MRKFIALIALIAVPGFAAAGDLSSAAHNLDQKAAHFVQQARHDRATKHLVKDAEKFAKEVRHFHKQVERRKSAHHLAEDYRKLNSRFGHLASALTYQHRGHTQRHLARDFDDLERAMARLSRAVHSSPYRDGYSDRGYDNRGYDDRDYNDRRYDDARYGGGYDSGHGGNHHRVNHTIGRVAGAIVAIAVLDRILD